MKRNIKQLQPGTPRQLLAAAVAACFTVGAHALPTAPTVVHGVAGFAQSGNVLSVTNSAGAIINWQKFGIAAGEATRFIQPSASSAVLNQVVGVNGVREMSQIHGTLSSNGKVWLVNPAGILVGASGVIDTAGFIASTLNVRAEDFLAGRLNFQATAGAGDVVNRGTITTPTGGSVYLVGTNVSNEAGGVITTPGGETVLAAGATVDLLDTSTPGVKVVITGAANNATNLGTIVAEAGRIGIAGTIVRNSGTLDASSVVNEGGRIFLRATKNIDLTDASKLGADGTAGGNITAIVRDNNSELSGDLIARGEISSQGNGSAGSGGFVETSAAIVNIATGFHVKTNGGNWLIDPVDYTIAASGGNITGATLSANLGSGNITILSSDGTVGTAGDVNVNDVVTWSANKLTLNAYNNININANLNGSGTASLALEYGQGAVAAGNTSAYKIASGAQVNLAAGPRFSTKLGSDGVVRNYTVITSLGAQYSTTAADLQGMNGNLTASYALGSDIDASPTATWAGGGFMPVGGTFTGAFDGLNHTIAGLTINRPAADYVGLFGYVGAGSVIRNVGLEGGSVSGHMHVGALIANTYNATISNSYSTASVTGSGDYVGGLVGYSVSTINNSYSTGSVTGSLGYVGGLVGIKDGGAISNSYSTSSVSGGNYVGGLVGYSISGTINNSYSTGSVSGGSSGGLVGVSAGTTTNNSFWDTQTSGQAISAAGTGKTTAEMKTAATFAGWSATSWNIANGSYPTLKNMPVPPAPPPACPGYNNCWTGAVNSLWATTGNWSAGHVPTGAESVKIDVAGTPTISIVGINPTFGSLWLAENLDVDAGVSFTLNNLFTLTAGTATFNGTASIYGYAQTGGTLAGSGAFTVTNNFTQTGGAINRTGSIAITQASGPLNFSVTGAPTSISATAYSGKITLNYLGNLDDGVTAVDLQTPGGGDIEIAATGNLTESDNILIYMPTGYTYKMTAGGNMVINGSDFSFPDNPMKLEAGNDLSVTGKIVATDLWMTAGNNISLTGDGTFSNGTVTANTGNINATVGGNITLSNGAYMEAGNDVYLKLGSATSRLDINPTGETAASFIWAKAPSTIYLDFLALSSGGVWINGIQTLITSGSSGLFFGPGFSPASPGFGLILTYGAAISSVINTITNTVIESTEEDPTIYDELPTVENIADSGFLVTDETIGGGTEEFGEGEVLVEETRGDSQTEEDRLTLRKKKYAQCKG